MPTVSRVHRAPLHERSRRWCHRVAAGGFLLSLRESERTLILHALEEVGWVIRGPKGAAAKLGWKRTPLIHKMQRLVISRPSLQSRQDMIGTAQREPDSSLQLDEDETRLSWSAALIFLPVIFPRQAENRTRCDIYKLASDTECIVPNMRSHGRPP